MYDPDMPTDATTPWPDDSVLPVPLPPGFPAAPAEASATLIICGHEISVILRDVNEARLLARMGGLIEACCEDHEHEEREEKVEEVN